MERGFKGKVYQTHGVANNDFLRVGGKALEGTFVPAGPVLVAGGRVAGGFVGAQPSLTDLDNGDLKFTTDFRDVYATLLHGVLGADPEPVLGPGRNLLPLLATCRVSVVQRRPPSPPPGAGRGASGSRAGGGFPTPPLAPRRRAAAAVAGSGMIFHSIRS